LEQFVYKNNVFPIFISINKLSKKFFPMSCGCKNKGNNNSQTNQNPQPNTQTAPTQQSVQETIKRTIEKYYTVNKNKR
jgi:hypothetical protein